MFEQKEIIEVFKSLNIINPIILGESTQVLYFKIKNLETLKEDLLTVFYSTVIVVSKQLKEQINPYILFKGQQYGFNNMKELRNIIRDHVLKVEATNIDDSLSQNLLNVKKNKGIIRTEKKPKL
jgi:hypothetical protein